MTNEDPIITWKNWQDGIADSPHLGTGLLQAVEIDTFSGAARVAKLPATAFTTATASTFTANAGTDTCTGATFTSNANTTDVAVQLTTTGTLPAGLTTGTTYFVIRVSQGGGTFKLATTIANAETGTAIDITDAGTGTHTVTTVNPGQINHYAVDPRTSITYAIDSNGRVWFLNGAPYRLLNGNTITATAGQGLAILRTSDGNATYLFAFRNAAIDVVNVFGSAQQYNPSWTNSWKSMNSGAGSGNSHHAINGQDNIIYFCDDRYIGSIAEKAGQVFDPANAATYTYNNQALDLPLGALTNWLEQLGINLLITNSNDGYIYPWDRSSDSYGLPIPIGEYGGNKMKNIGNLVYVTAGTRGNIYWTQGTYVRLFKQLPIFLTYNTTSIASNPVSWGGIGGANGKLIVGVGALSGYSGVYMMDAQGHLSIDNVPSVGSTRVTAIYATDDFYQMGYSTGGDYSTAGGRYTALGTVLLQSQLYRLGTKTEKATISQIECQLASGVSGSIRIGYRGDLTSAFTNIPDPSGNTTTFATTSADTSYQNDCGLINLENIQFQIELAGSIDLMEFRAFK